MAVSQLTINTVCTLINIHSQGIDHQNVQIFFFFLFFLVEANTGFAQVLEDKILKALHISTLW